MSSTFTGPIRIFKRNNPTNDGVIAADNTGAAVVSQQVPFLSSTGPVEVTLPAGAIVQSVNTYITVPAGTTGTPDVTIGAVTVATLSNDSGVNAATFVTGVTGVALLANVGPVDATLSFTPGVDAEGVLSVTYTARNADGTITAYGSGYTNN